MFAEIKHHSGEFRINNIDSVNVESYSVGTGFEFDNLNDYLEAKKLIINEIDVFGPEELRVVFYDKNKNKLAKNDNADSYASYVD